MEFVSKEDILELDLHSYTADAAKALVLQEIKTAPAHIKAINVIHGYSGEAKLLNIVRKSISHPRISKIKPSLNPGTTIIYLKKGSEPFLKREEKKKKPTRKARKIKAAKLKKLKKEEKIKERKNKRKKE